MTLSYHRLDTGLRVLVLVGAVPTALLVVLLESGPTGGPGLAAVLVAAALLSVPLGIAFLSGVLIRLRDGAVRIGFLPFYWVTLDRRDIARVDSTEVAPFEDFGGWGIKGRASKSGLLFSAGGTGVVEILLKDGRRYLASADDPQRVRDVLRAELDLRA